MVRLLLVIAFLFTSRGFASPATYLSSFEKAVVTLSLKAQFLSVDEVSDLAPRLARKIESVSKQVPLVVYVPSLEEYLELQKNSTLFADYKLDEVSIEQLFKQINNTVYVGSTPKVQRKIESYKQLRSEQLQKIAGTASSILLNFLNTSNVNNLGGLRDQFQQQFDQSLESLGQRLSASQSPQVLVLAKLLKMYFTTLPKVQKAEIFYRLIQIPIESDPMDIFLMMIQHTGPQLQKLMQIIGRSDEIPVEFKNVFQKLESQVTPVPWWKVEKLLKSEGVRLGDFAYFEKVALGVGTMAQTHRAQLIGQNGARRDLVVRFLKPGIEKNLEMDHQILIQIAAKIDTDPELAKYKLPSMKKLVDDLHSSVEEELFLNLTIQNQNFAKKVYSKKEMISYSNQRNELTINVPNASLFGNTNQLMAQDLVFGGKPAKEFKTYAKIYPDLYKSVAEALAAQWIDQAFFKSGYFHADLHQGNILASVTDEQILVNILDFGMTGVLNSQQRESALMLSLALRLQNAEMITKYFLNLSTNAITSKALNPKEFLAAVRTRLNLLKKDKSLADSLESWTVWALDQGLELHYEFLKLNRGLTAIQSLMEDSQSPMNIEKIAQQVAWKNKKYVSKLLLSDPLMKSADFTKLAEALFNTPAPTSTLAPLQCHRLF